VQSRVISADFRFVVGFFVCSNAVWNNNSQFGGLMAKRGAGPATEHKLEEFSEDLGRLLGTAQAKAEGWLGQRQQITKHLEDIRTTATHLLQQLGNSAVGLTRRRGRSAGSGRGPGRPKGSVRKRRTMSAAARAKISAAQKKRWAKVKAAEKK
jgi:hypothetical protein